MQHLLGISKVSQKLDPDFVKKLEELLSAGKGSLTLSRNLNSTLSYITVEKYSAIWLDWDILKENYSSFFRKLQRIDKHLPVILFYDVTKLTDEILQSNRQLFAMIHKSELIHDLPDILVRINEYHSLYQSLQKSIAEELSPNGFGMFVGNSLHMLEVYRQIVRVATTDFTVLVLGGRRQREGKSLQGPYMSTALVRIMNLSH